MDEKKLDNLEVWWEGQENETPEMDNSHTAKEERYKQQMLWSKQEAERMKNLLIDREVKNAERDARSLLELHEVDPKLADEVAKKFGYDNFEDAKGSINQAESDSWMSKTRDANFQENFDKYYQERKAKETHEEALQRATKILNKIKDEGAREKAQKQFEKIVWNKQLSIDEAEEFAEMATLFVNKDSLKADKYDESIVNYASTWMWMGKKANANDWKVEVVRNWRIVLLDNNKQ